MVERRPAAIVMANIVMANKVMFAVAVRLCSVGRRRKFNRCPRSFAVWLDLCTSSPEDSLRMRVYIGEADIRTSGSRRSRSDCNTATGMMC
jgi:hypothetical protein